MKSMELPLKSKDEKSTCSQIMGEAFLVIVGLLNKTKDLYEDQDCKEQAENDIEMLLSMGDRYKVTRRTTEEEEKMLKEHPYLRYPYQTSIGG